VRKIRAARGATASSSPNARSEIRERNKPTPALLATDSFNEQAVRDDLRRTITSRSMAVWVPNFLKYCPTIRLTLSAWALGETPEEVRNS
jgi:hypothetical protein